MRTQWETVMMKCRLPGETAPESFTAEIPDLGTGRGNNGEAYLMNCNSHEYIVLRGLTFTGCATTIHSGMVKTGTARHMLIEDCTFNNANGQGLEIEHGTGERIPENKRTGVYEG